MVGFLSTDFQIPAIFHHSQKITVQLHVVVVVIVYFRLITLLEAKEEMPGVLRKHKKVKLFIPIKRIVCLLKVEG